MSKVANRSVVFRLTPGQLVVVTEALRRILGDLDLVDQQPVLGLLDKCAHARQRLVDQKIEVDK